MPDDAVSTIAYKYGCPSWVTLDEQVTGQFRLANAMWNAMVEAERDHQDQIEAIWGRHPEVAVPLEALAVAAQALAEVEAAMREARQADGTTVPRKSDAVRLKDARSAHRAAKAAVKAAKSAVIEAGAEPGFTEAKAACRACQSRWTSRPDSFYKEFRAAGLGWGTVNDVLARFRVASARVGSQRTEGMPAELRFHRFDGSGTLAVQVQREAGDPVPTPELLASDGGKWRNVARIGPWADPAGERPKGVARHGAAVLRVADGITAEVPVVLHRYLPAGSEVKRVTLTRSRVAGQSRVSVQVTARVPDAVSRESGAGVAVDLSWKSAGGGWLHAASVASTATLPPLPRDLEGIVRVAEGGASADVLFPPAWRAVLDRCARVRGYRDQMLEHARDVAAGALKAEPGLEAELGRTGAEVSRWRSAGRLARLVMDWRARRDAGAAPPLPLVPAGLLEPGGPAWSCASRGEHAHDLECWRMRDRHLWEFESHERDQAVARRRDAYRKVAGWLLEGAQSCALRELDHAALRRVPDVGREDSEQSRRSRGNAQAVAPGEPPP